jgi:hypothetical protein
VIVSGSGLVTLGHKYVITGCGLPAATLGTQPACFMGVMANGAMKVQSMGIPVAIYPGSMSGSQGQPNPTPLIFAPGGQTRVWAT